MLVVKILVLVLMLFLIYLLIAIYWNLFKKCGEAGWKCLIPFYNFYILGKIAYNSGFGWAFLICMTVGNIVVGLVALINDGIAAFIYFIFLIIYIACHFGIGERFNKSIGFKIALCIPFIQIFLFYHLAFNDDNVYEKKQPIKPAFNDDNVYEKKPKLYA